MHSRRIMHRGMKVWINTSNRLVHGFVSSTVIHIDEDNLVALCGNKMCHMQTGKDGDRTVENVDVDG